MSFDIDPKTLRKLSREKQLSDKKNKGYVNTSTKVQGEKTHKQERRIVKMELNNYLNRGYED